MSTATVDRKYALIRVATQDYLLPSNDHGMLWRITTYEDGPSHGLDWPADRTFWGAWRYIGRVAWRNGMTGDQMDELLDWNDWSGPWDSGLETRRAAIASVMQAN